MLKLGRVTKVKVFFLVLVYVFNIDLFEFSFAILERGILQLGRRDPVSFISELPTTSSHFANWS